MGKKSKLRQILTICQPSLLRKRFSGENQQRKERDYLIRKIQGLSLDELASFCLHKTRTKLIQHPNATVKEFFVLWAKPNLLCCIIFTTDIRQNIPGLVLTLSSIRITLSQVVIGSKHRGTPWRILVGIALPAESSLSTSLESLQQDVVHLTSSSDSSHRHCF